MHFFVANFLTDAQASIVSAWIRPCCTTGPYYYTTCTTILNDKNTARCICLYFYIHIRRVFAHISNIVCNLCDELSYRYRVSHERATSDIDHRTIITD